MDKEISIFLLDESNNIKSEIKIFKPNTYESLISKLKFEIPNLPQYYNISYQSKENSIIEIHNNKDYKSAGNIFFIKQIDIKDLKKSIFSLNYNQLSESKQEFLDEKFNCYICSEQIKNENPLFCYSCQKNFHYKCLEKWEKKSISQNKILSCPNCRKELPLKEWKQRLDYEESRKNEANMMNIIKQFKDSNDIIQKMHKKDLDKLKNDKIDIDEKFKIFKKISSI